MVRFRKGQNEELDPNEIFTAEKEKIPQGNSRKGTRSEGEQCRFRITERS